MKYLISILIAASSISAYAFDIDETIYLRAARDGNLYNTCYYGLGPSLEIEMRLPKFKKCPKVLKLSEVKSNEQSTS